ncbi:MAG: hypothetical protein GY861_24810 [bacterium]|nr:hypothetical protein [bacterium]
MREKGAIIVLRQRLKMKRLLPSLREKKRYLVFEVISKSKLSRESAIKAIKQGMVGFLGEKDTAKANIAILNEWNSKTQRGLMKVNRNYVDQIKGALCLVKKAGRKEIIVKSVGVSGMIKKAKNKYLA